MESLKGIGCGIDVRIFEKMKHISQSVVNKHHGTLHIFVSNRCTGKRIDKALICLKPLLIPLNKNVSLCQSFDPVDLGEEYPQLLTGFGFRIGPEPAHPFMLDMIQTSLKYRFWPNQPDGSRNRTLTVGGYESRIQSLTLEIAKPGISFLKGFFLNIRVGDYLLIDSIHKIQEAAVLVEVGRIIKQVLHHGEIDLFFGHLFKPIVLNAVKCSCTITGKLLKPSNRTALGDPQLEPAPPAVDAVILLFPNECALTS
jgi:hypothetical protein